MLSVVQVVMQLPNVTSLEEFKLWYAKLDVLGFPKAVLADVAVDILVNFITFKATEVDYTAQIAYLQSEIDGYQAQIATRQQEMADAEGEITFLRAQIQMLIDTLPDGPLKDLALAAQIQMEYDITMESDLENVRRATYSLYGWEWSYWDNDHLDQLMYYQDQVLLYTYGPMADPDSASAMQTEYDNYWNGLYQDQREKYTNILDASYNRFFNRYTNFYPALDAMSALAPMGQNIASQMVNASREISDWNRQLLYFPDELVNWEYQIRWREEEIQRLSENQMMFSAINAFFLDPENVTLTKDVVLIVLDEFEYVLANVDTLDVAFIQALMEAENPMALLDMSAAGILGYTTDLSAFMKLFGTTTDAADDAKIVLLAQKINAARINADPVLTTEEKTAMIAVWNEAIAEYYTAANDSIVYVTNFLDSLTVDQIQIVMAQITILKSLGELETTEANIARAIAIAKIVMVIDTNPTINPDLVIAFGLKAYFDFKYEFTFTDTAYIDAEIAELQLLILAITETADDVYLIDDTIPLTPEQMTAIEAFHLAIEDLIAYKEVGPDPVV
jgi:hypothetical protein